MLDRAPGPARNGFRVDLRTWQRLIEGYRQMPGDHAHAARVAGVQRKTAQRLWQVGRRGEPWGVKPIREILMDEREVALSRLEAERAATPSDPTAQEIRRSREEAIKAKVAEYELLRYARLNVQGLFQMSTTLTATGLRLAQRVAATLDHPDFAKNVNLAQALITLSRMATIIQKGVGAAHTTADLERLVNGDPSERAGSGGAGAGTSDEDVMDTLSRLEGAKIALERRGWRVVRGGRGQPLPVIPTNEGAIESEITPMGGACGDSNENEDLEGLSFSPPS